MIPTIPRYILQILFCFLLNIAYSQQAIPMSSQILAQKELADRGLDETEVARRLELKGFDTNNIKPEELPALELALKQVVEEMENEKGVIDALQSTEIISQPANPDSPSTEQAATEENAAVNQKIANDFQENIPSGSSVEEAVSETKEELIDNSLQDPSNIYGHGIFTEADLSLYKNADDIPTPPSYILGSGDQLKISIFGRSQADFQYVIGPDGYIQPSQMGKIFLKGLTIEKARELVQNRFSQRYTFSHDQFSLVLSTARTVTISIFGEVGQPGSYTLSALNTAFNALVACYGPKPNGSVRKIRLIRENNVTEELDVYEYLSNPMIRFNYPINNGDVIYVPFSKKIVTINGAVKRPMRYELIDRESLMDLIDYAGGLNTNAYLDLIKITRQGNNQQDLLELNLGEMLRSGQDFDLENGDVITIDAQLNNLKSFVSIDGAVLFPGNYSGTENRFLTSLLKKAQFSDQARTDFAYLVRSHDDGTQQLIYLNPAAILKGEQADIELQAKDKIQIYTLARFLDATQTISISGSVRHPLTETFEVSSNIRLSDFIEMAGGLTPNATGQGLLTRISKNNSLKLEYIPIDLDGALQNPLSDANMLLLPGDVIQAYNVEYYEDQYQVNIVGMVRNPQSFIYDPSLTFQDIITDAGGLLPQANRYGMVVRIDLTNSLRREYEMIDVDALLSGESEIILQPGDEIRIYNSETYSEQFDISVVGAVKKSGSYTYSPSLSISDALLMAGGLTFSADPLKVEVYRLQFGESTSPKSLVKSLPLDTDGNVLDAKDKNFQLEPFDIIIVRTIPDFRLQEMVEINGQVRYPGPYVLTNQPEKLDNIIRRAGGLLPDAFPQGATLFRTEGRITGEVVISLHKVLYNENHNTNISLLKGDIIDIPKREDLVVINLKGTRTYFAPGESKERININFDGRKSAAWYIRNYAGGFEKEADRKSVTVIYPNGKIQGTKGAWIFRDYPLVTSGSYIQMNLKPEKTIAQKPEKKEIDWGQTLQATLTTASLLSTLVTTIVLINKL